LIASSGEKNMIFFSLCNKKKSRVVFFILKKFEEAKERHFFDIFLTLTKFPLLQRALYR
jgi:hypothetical protein